MSRLVSIHKGLDIRLQGLAEKQLKILPNSRIICISPLDFHGLNPKLLVKEGDSVKIGDPLFFDKTNEALHFVTPASGTVKSIIRGEKRKILQVLIETNENQEYKNGSVEDVSKLSSEELKTKMLACGLWPFIKQRPIDSYIHIIQPSIIRAYGPT